MTRQGSKPTKTRKRKWWRRALLGVAVLGVVVAAVPFVFTGAVIRFYVAHSSLRDMGVTFESARLSPMGALTVRGLQIADTGAGKRLLAAEMVRVDFSWTDVMKGRVRTIWAQGAEVNLRREKDGAWNVTKLFATPAANQEGQGAAAATNQSSAAGGGGVPFWFDQIVVTGACRVAGVDRYMGLLQLRGEDPIRLQAVAKSLGEAARPSREISLILGDPESATGPVLTTRVTIKEESTGTALNVEQLTLQNAKGALVAEAWPELPAFWRRGLTGKLDRLAVIGNVVFGKEVTVNGAMELRDFSAGMGGAGELAAMEVDHFSFSTRVEGKVTGDPLKDLVFKNSHCTWEGMQYGEHHLLRGQADLGVEGNEIELADLQGTLDDFPVMATAAMEAQTGNVTRARLLVNRIPVGRVLEKVPAAVRSEIPGAVDGEISARVFLNEVDGAHLAARVEVTCEDALRLFAGDPKQEIGKGSVPLVSVMNSDLSGIVTWNFGAGSAVEISRGRFTADDVFVSRPSSAAALDLSSVKSDFACRAGGVEVLDCYADLPGNGDGELSAQGTYSMGSGTLEKCTINIKEADLSMIEPWLGGVFMHGTVNAALELHATPESAEGIAGLTFSADVGSEVRGENAGQVGLEGASVPAVSLRATFDRATHGLRVQFGEVTGLGTVKVDAGYVAWARKVFAPAEGSGLAGFFEQVKAGAYLDVKKIEWSGEWAPAKQLAATMAMTGVTVGVLSNEGKEAVAEGATIKGSMAAALDGKRLLEGMEVTGGEVQAKSVNVGEVVLKDLAAKVALKGKPGAMTVAMEAISAAEVTDQTRAATVEGLSLKGNVELPVDGRALVDGLVMTGGEVHAKSATVGEVALEDVSAMIAAKGKEATLAGIGVKLADGEANGEGVISLVRGVESLNVKFKGVEQKILTQWLYPDYFTAEGPISGTLTLGRSARQALEGSIEVTGDDAGRLKISKETSQSTFGPVAKAAVANQGVTLPANFDDILTGQLSNFPYLAGGSATVKDEAGGMTVTLKYHRPPLSEGDPGYGVLVPSNGLMVRMSLPINIDGISITIENTTIAERLLKAEGLVKKRRDP